MQQFFKNNYSCIFYDLIVTYRDPQEDNDIIVKKLIKIIKNKYLKGTGD